MCQQRKNREFFRRLKSIYLISHIVAQMSIKTELRGRKFGNFEQATTRHTGRSLN